MHHHFRRSRSEIDIARFYPFLELITKDIRSGLLPPHPYAHVHLIGIYKELKKYDAGYEFWKWLSTQDNTYVNQAVYGAAIELLAYQGQTSLETLEELYAQGLQRFPGTYAAYHLSPEAIVPDRSQPTMISGLPMVLLQGILTARILKRDWKGSYLALDTALRLYPAQLPPRFFELFIKERPILEGYTVFLLACRAGVRMQPNMLGSVLGHLTRAMDNCDSMEARTVLLGGMVTAIYASKGSGGLLTEHHFRSLICAFGHLFPSKQAPKGEEGAGPDIRKAVALAAERISTDLSRTGMASNESIANALMFVACKTEYPDLLLSAIHKLQMFPSKNLDDITRRNVLISVGHFKRKDLVEHYWNELVSSAEEAGHQLSLKDWLSFARAAKRAGHEEYFVEQCENLAHTLTENTRVLAMNGLQTDENAPEIRVDFEWMDPSLFAGRLEGLRVQILQLGDLILKKQGLDFHKHPLPMFLDPSRRTLGSESDLRAIYDELTLDPHQLPPSQDGSNIKPALSSTGIPLDELRFQNWCVVAELMNEAAAAEQELGRRINEAIASGSPFHISPSALGFELSRALPSSSSGEESEITHSFRDEVREKILRLRSSSSPSAS